MSQKRSKAEWKRLYEEQRKSGKTLKRWCEEKGIKLSTMSDRLSRMRKEGQIEREKQVRKENPISSQKQEWLEMKPKEISETKSRDIQIELGDFKISVSEDFNEELLMRTCQVIKQLC